MHIDLPEPECSKCGHRNSETFQRGSVQGRRCLNCKHEQTVNIRTAETSRSSESITYSLKDKQITF